MDERKLAVTKLLSEAGRGALHGDEEAVRYLYEELRTLASGLMRRLEPGQTLQPTALVNEVYLRLTQGEGLSWESRRHFFAWASKAMRSVIVDHVRKISEKGGGHLFQIALGEVDEAASSTGPDPETLSWVLSLNLALEKLEAIHPRKARVVEQRFFAGLPFKDIAEINGMTLRTTEREWQRSRAWLKTEIGRERGLDA